MLFISTREVRATPGRAMLSTLYLTHYTMRKIVTCILLITLFTSCARYAYYQSPLHTNTHSYKTIPLKSENKPAATYASVAVTTGGTNEKLKDGYIGVLGSGYRAHNFGSFQAFYGISGSWGNYKVDSFFRHRDNPGGNRYVANTVNDSLINREAGRKSWGSVGGYAGINLVKSFQSGGEWRVLGAEMSWTHELGNYFDFRRKLPDTAANLIDRSRHFLTFAVSTEFIGKIDEVSLSYKIACGGSLRKMPGYDKQGKPTNYTSDFLCQTLTLTFNRTTIFGQWNIGTYAMGLHIGANMRISQ